ncbi:MAG: LacI family DNA-binding transcriptional regulator [Lentisphaeria bacterium]
MSRVTLKQLAEYTGFSIRTVNRALKGDESVIDSKRSAILTAAKKFHYVPNMAARNLRMNQTNFVGIIGENAERQVFTKKLNFLERTLKARGYYPILGYEKSDVKRFSKLLDDWSGITQKIIIMTSSELLQKAAFKELLSYSPMDFIFVDAPEQENSVNFSIDRSSGVYEAIVYLGKMGHQSILHCGSIANRMDGIKKALSFFSKDQRPTVESIISGNEFKDGYALGNRIVASGADAVFFDTDRLASGFLYYAVEHQISIPDDIAVIGFDDDPADVYLYPTLSTVAQPIQELAEAIADTIADFPEAPETMSRVFNTKFIRRQSV